MLHVPGLIMGLATLLRQWEFHHALKTGIVDRGVVLGLVADPDTKQGFAFRGGG